MVVVNAGPLSRFQSSWVNVHQRLFVGDHFIQLLQFPLLPRQLVIHNSTSPRRRAQFRPPLVTFFMVSVCFTPSLAGPVFAPLPASASTPAGALAPAATPAPALGAASGALV